MDPKKNEQVENKAEKWEAEKKTTEADDLYESIDLSSLKVKTNIKAGPFHVQID